jgi:hypothetical protein
VAVTLAFAPQHARADEQVPFRGAFTTEFETVVEFPIIYVLVIGHGTATHLGKATAVTTDQAVNIITGAGTATYTLTAANGDTVVLEMEFQMTPSPDPDRREFEGIYTVTGGTGRFAGATGGGMLNGSVTFTGPNNGVGSFTVVGTISSPGSLLTKAGDAVVPFKAHIQTYPEIVDITDGILTIEVSGEGQATHLGQCTWYSEFQVDTTQNPNLQTGTMEFTAANGDQLFGTFAGEATPPTPGVPTEFWGAFEITGGTGRFEGVTGAGDYWGKAEGDEGKLYFDGMLTK